MVTMLHTDGDDANDDLDGDDVRYSVDNANHGNDAHDNHGDNSTSPNHRSTAALRPPCRSIL